MNGFANVVFCLYVIILTAISGYMLIDWFGFGWLVGFVWLGLFAYATHVGGKIYDWMCDIDRAAIAKSLDNIAFLDGQIKDLTNKSEDRSLSVSEKSSILSNLRNLRFEYERLNKEYEVLTHNAIG